MPRKKARLAQKKRIAKKEERRTPGGLSQQEFAALVNDYGSFLKEDPEHEVHTFSVGDVVYIQWQDLEDDDVDPPEDYWIAEIKQIRANRPDDVWVQVQWFWAPEEVAEVIKSFDPSICGKYEKLSSNNHDIISVHCVVDHVEVKPFDETSIYQASIDDEEWFSRFQFLYDGKRITPKLTHSACNICKIPYTPGQDKALHFCPRPSCRRFYHQSCLVKHGYVDNNRPHTVLETWPDVDRSITVEDLCVLPLAKRHKSSDCSSKGHNISFSDIPPMLLAVAEQPMVRGHPGGGIVGNIPSVSTARSLIFKALTKNGVIPDDWESKIDDSFEFIDTDTYPNCVCPSCLSPI